MRERQREKKKRLRLIHICPQFNCSFNDRNDSMDTFGEMMLTKLVDFRQNASDDSSE